MTYEEVMEMITATGRNIDKLVAKQAETDARIEKIFAEREAQFVKSEAQFAKTEAQIAKTEAQIAKSERKLASMGIQLGNIGINNGMATEDYFFNSLLDNLELGGITFDSISKNIHTKTKKLEDEYDIVMYNGNSVALIECKYKAHENDVRRLINKKVANFRVLFPDFKDYTIYLGIGSFSFYPELETFARENGVAILKQKGEVMEVEANGLKAY
ncbi:hypothetical protein [Parasediminibacterium sp. JCM 36343]|uniref:hypothetical protein n=1 Tax=Parasediminibacterium sp. JCM 36343 TaxID=3374279 RepID=UPI00397CF33B